MAEAGEILYEEAFETGSIDAAPHPGLDQAFLVADAHRILSYRLAGPTDTEEPASDR